MSDNPQPTDAPQEPTQPETSQGEHEGQNTSDKTFSQSDVDRIVGERAKRAAEAERKRFLEDLGIDDFDSIKTLLTAEQQRKEAEMSEVEKLQKQIAK